MRKFGELEEKDKIILTLMSILSDQIINGFCLRMYGNQLKLFSILIGCLLVYDECDIEKNVGVVCLTKLHFE